jgi:hypothetical protein
MIADDDEDGGARHSGQGNPGYNLMNIENELIPGAEGGLAGERRERGTRGGRR